MWQKTAGLVVVVVGLCCALPVAGGEIIGIVHESVGDTEHLANIHPTTGNIELETGIGDCCWVSTGASAIDEANGLVFFLGAKFTDSSSQRRVFKVDVGTGAVLSSPLLDGGSTDYNYNFLEFRESTGTLYAVAYNAGLASSTGNATRQEELLTINTTTGAVSTVGAGIAECCWVSSGVSAIDDDGAVFFFLGAKYTDTSSQRRLFSVDLATGAASSSPLLDGGSTDYSYNFIERDPDSGTLYMVAYNLGLASSSGGTTKQEELLTVDTATGAVTTVGTGLANCCWVSSGASGFDGERGIFYFLGAEYSDSSSQRRLFSVNASTGAAEANPLVDGGSTTYNHNFMELYIGEVFADGFESSNTSGWTSTTP